MNNPFIFGKYLLLDRISVGGMAEVFIAKTGGVEGFQRLVAIKRILPTVAEDENLAGMFIDEARITALLNHANIARFYEFGRHHQSLYLALEYVAGWELGTILEKFRERHKIVPMPATLFIAAKICEGLDYAHCRRDLRGNPLHIVHRDVSPRNVLVSYDGEVKIIDFGIAKAENRSHKTQVGILKGKFGYMSPEQVLGLPMDHRSDVFAVGAILYEMLTGHKLFHGESDLSTLDLVKNARVPGPRKLNSAISPHLETVLLKALARDPEQRYQRASELFEELMRALTTADAVYSSRRLSHFMQESFPDAFAAEVERLEKFSRAPFPSNNASTDEALIDTYIRPALESSDGTVIYDRARAEAQTTSFYSRRGENIVELPDTLTEPAQGWLASPASLQSEAPTLTAHVGNVTNSADPESIPPTQLGPHELGRSLTPVMSQLGSHLPIHQADRLPPSSGPVSRSNASRITSFLLAAAGAAVAAMVIGIVVVTRRTTSVSVLLDVEPRNATILIDGLIVPNGSKASLSPGEYDVDVSAPTFQKHHRRLLVSAGQPAIALGVRLEPTAADKHPTVRSLDQPAETPGSRTNPEVFSVQFKSSESEVNISVDGRLIGRTPNASISGLATGKDHPYVATKAGFRPRRGLLKSDTPGEIQVPIQLERAVALARRAVNSRKKGQFACSSLPAGAQVWVDNKYSGRTTPISIGNPLVLPVGLHVVVFKMPDGTKQSDSQPIEIKENEITKLVHVLLN